MIKWLTIHVHDLEKSQNFYGDFLGLKLSGSFAPRPGMQICFYTAANGVEVELIHSEGASFQPVNSAVSIGIAVSNFEELLAQARQQKLLLAGPETLGGGLQCFFLQDPDGVGIQIIRA